MLFYSLLKIEYEQMLMNTAYSLSFEDKSTPFMRNWIYKASGQNPCVSTIVYLKDDVSAILSLLFTSSIKKIQL